MSLLIFVVCMFFIVLSLLIDKKKYNPIILFNFWWGITILISGFGFFGIYVPTINTYIIMLVGIISFNFACIARLTIGIKKWNISNQNDNITYYSLKEVIYFIIVVQLLVIVELLRRSLIVMQLLTSGMDYERIRYIYFATDEIISGYNQILSSYLVTPVITFSLILVSLLLIEKKINKTFMFTTTICVGLFSFSSGGRGIILTFGLTMFLAFLIQDKQIKIKFSKKIWLTIFFAIIIYSLSYITIARGTSANFTDVLRTVTLYFTAPYIFFEQLSPYALQNTRLLYGGAFFGGIVDTVILVCRFLGGLDFNTMSSYIGKYNQMYLYVGGSLNYNAFPTMIYTFLYDFNYLGVILGPLLFGVIAMWAFKKMVTANRIAFKGIYIMIALMIYESVMKWTGTSAVPWIVIALFLILDKLARARIRF